MSRQKTLLKANIDFRLLKYLKEVNEHFKTVMQEDYEGWNFLINQIIRAGLPNNLHDESGNPYIPDYELYDLPIKREEERQNQWKYEVELERVNLKEMYPEDFTDE